MLPPSIFDLRHVDKHKQELAIQGYTADFLTDNLLDSVIVLAELNFKNLQHLSIVDCALDFKRVKSLKPVFNGHIVHMAHLNLNRNPLREQGVIEVIKMANRQTKNEITMM